jgi:hypothetical protein
MRLSFSCGVHATMFQTETFAILAYAKECIGRAYTGQCICICSDGQAALRVLESSRVMSKLVWECHALSSWNKIMLLWVPSHYEIQGDEDADVFAREGLCHSFLGPEPAISVPLCVGRLKVKDWLN